MWYHLAETLGLPVQLVKQFTTSRELIRWGVYFEQKINKFDPLHYYLAAIRADIDLLGQKIAKVMSGKGSIRKIKITEKLLKFEKQQEKTPVLLETDPEVIAKRIQSSKQSWFAAVGLNSRGEQKEKSVTTTPKSTSKKKRTK